MRPFPERMYQTSSTVRWATAFDMAFGGSEKIARPPRDNWHSTRTSEPSGAIASGALAMRLVSKPKAQPTYGHSLDEPVRPSRWPLCGLLRMRSFDLLSRKYLIPRSARRARLEGRSMFAQPRFANRSTGSQDEVFRNAIRDAEGRVSKQTWLRCSADQTSP
jgi:hypothetical protein